MLAMAILLSRLYRLMATPITTHTPAWELLPQVKEALPEAILFADVSNYEEARRAVDLGADIVGPTLYGYTEQTKHIEEPNLREFARMCRDLRDEAYLIMEGHIYDHSFPLRSKAPKEYETRYL